MKKLVNALAIVASFAFSSIANAGLINSFDDSYLDSLVNGGSTITQLLGNGNSVNYTYKDNFMLVDLNYLNFNYLLYDFTILHEDGNQDNFLTNLYLPSGYSGVNYFEDTSFLEVYFDFNKPENLKFVLEVDDSLNFLDVDILNHNNGDVAYILSNDFQTEEWTSFGSPLIGAARANAVPAPVPEPSTLAIFALGMFGLARRKFNKKS